MRGRQFAIILTLILGVGCTGRNLGELCRIDECRSGLRCAISEDCQDGSPTCHGVCRTACTSPTSTECPEGQVCGCSSFSGCFCLPSDCQNYQSPTCQ